MRLDELDGETAIVDAARALRVACPLVVEVRPNVPINSGRVLLGPKLARRLGVTDCGSERSTSSASGAPTSCSTADDDSRAPNADRYRLCTSSRDRSSDDTSFELASLTAAVDERPASEGVRSGRSTVEDVERVRRDCGRDGRAAPCVGRVATSSSSSCERRELTSTLTGACELRRVVCTRARFERTASAVVNRLPSLAGAHLESPVWGSAPCMPLVLSSTTSGSPSVSGTSTTARGRIPFSDSVRRRCCRGRIVDEYVGRIKEAWCVSGVGCRSERVEVMLWPKRLRQMREL